jgi:hypothetical protein
VGSSPAISYRSASYVGMRPLLAGILFFVLLLPTTVAAQQATADVEKLPISLERIRKRLAEVPASETAGLKLDFYVEVHGEAPKIDVFGDFNFTSGSVRYGSPTHAEFLALVTPQHFRAPTVDFLSLAMTGVKALADRELKRRAERERARAREEALNPPGISRQQEER